jgi:NADH-quinone oxidoreductase subunit M
MLPAQSAGRARPRLFYLMLALGETAVLGAFCAQDLALFVLFFDLMLVPFYFLIGVWGGPGRVRATTTFVIYTLVGSLLMLAAAVATGILATPDGGEVSFELTQLTQRKLSEGSQEWIFLCFALAFLVKMPAFPLHAWVPGAYTAAPTPVVAVLSGVLSKVAAYGFLRIVLPVFPDASITFQELMLVISVASILYGSVMAFTQTSATLVVAYSSIAQLGFITLGIFSLRDEGAQGAVIQMVNHGLVVVPLFFIIALLAARVGGTDDLRRMGGLAVRAPVLAALFLIVALATLAMPGSANFVGEFLILTGAFKAKIVYAIVAGAGIALAAVYMIRLYQRSMHNPLAPGAESREMSVADAVVIVPIVAVILFLAVYPQFVLERSESAVTTQEIAVIR